jgi:hypothetical protein
MRTAVKFYFILQLYSTGKLIPQTYIQSSPARPVFLLKVPKKGEKTGFWGQIRLDKKT